MCSLPEDGRVWHERKVVRPAGSTGSATHQLCGLVIEVDRSGQSFGLHQGPLEDSRRSKLLNFLAQNRHSITLIILRRAFRVHWHFEDNGSMKILTLIAM